MKTTFTVPSEEESLPLVLSHFSKIDQDWISEKDWLRCELALVEGFTNALNHAHKNLPAETKIEIEVNITRENMEIRIFDSGPGFDLAGYIEQLNLEDDFSPTGRGIRILLKIANHLSYTRTSDNNRNCLLIVKEFAL
ncbi:MAG: ATP-binding protein [Gomphosphaeria aponina SAG 52.96 = DSM 107014]|uniref:ATP-binding protein n=1 Tax=Gomphosphaeria aponina SAG 52.96 = DSM 107014 TaxID=1521640 RepID=A0A941GQ51_9CHRO|nr:ATP-binding protein [Gomphosphaeria aponina SAG 52.96 = DSM 107014]